jgi:squalene-associated FAD-dependent desaturase
MPEPDVAVIGAGWAGMAAAVTLAAGGARVCVFESAKQLGGRARSVEVNGLQLDNGQHILLGAYSQTLALISSVNARHGEQLLRQPLALAVHPGFLLRTPQLPAPVHLAAALVTARGLSVGDRIGAVRFLARMRRRGFRLPQDRPLSALLAEHRQSERLNRFLWHPLCLAALNTPPHEASAQVFLNVMRDAFTRGRADSDLLLPRADLSALFPEPAAAYVEQRGGTVRRGRRASRIAQEDGAWIVEVDGETKRFDALVCAVPPQRAADLLAGLRGLQATCARIRALRYEPIYTVYLQYPATTRLPGPMLGLAEGPGQWVFDRGQLGGPGGLLAVVISAAGPHQALEHTALAEQVAAQLRALLDLQARPLWQQVIAEKRATFACVPNLDRPDAQTPLPGLYLAGDYVAGDYPATIEGAARSGVQCARHILESR